MATSALKHPEKVALFVASAALFVLGTKVALTASAARVAYSALQLQNSMNLLWTVDLATAKDSPLVLGTMPETVQQVFSRVDLAPTGLKWLGFILMAAGTALLVSTLLQTKRPSGESKTV